MSKTIRRRDGTLDEVADDYALQSGESIYHFMRHMDRGPDPAGVEYAEQVTRMAMGGGGAPVAPVHDGRGGAAGLRPGYVFAGDAALPDAASTERLADEAEAARREMIDGLSTAWMRKPRTRKERRERERQRAADRQPPDMSDVKGLRDAADEARRQYVERTVNSWRTR
jgi:hypothetical protein